MKKALFCLVALAALAGCASAPVPSAFVVDRTDHGDHAIAVAAAPAAAAPAGGGKVNPPGREHPGKGRHHHGHRGHSLHR